MMDLGRKMASWWFVALLAVSSSLATPPLAAAQAVSPPERDALVRLYVEKGGRAEDVELVIRRADDAAAKTLPVAPLTNKIREGIAKGYDAKRIDMVIQQMVAQFEGADRLLRELEPAAAGAERDVSLTLLVESIGSGVTADEVRELLRQARSPGGPVSPERLSGAAKGLSFIKEAKLPVADATAVMAEALRQGFRPVDMLDLGRAIKLRQNDYREGRASLRAVRDAIARGDRPDQLFRDGRGETATRPAPERPETPAQRPERPTRPEPPPQRPERPQPPERPTRPDRPGGAR